MHMQLHLASDYARPITAVKLDCRRLSPADRPNKTRIFSGIIPAPRHLACRARRAISILYFTVARRPHDNTRDRRLFADDVGRRGRHSIPFIFAPKSRETRDVDGQE